MIVSTPNYNALGKVGPHYERPEYRPPSGGGESARPDRPSGDRRTLSARSARDSAPKAAPQAPPPVSAAKLNPASAMNLVRDLAAQISGLPPLSTDREPHAWLRKTSLLTPVYV